jgi:hypothetical protein
MSNNAGATKDQRQMNGVPTIRIIAATTFMLFGVLGSLKLKTSAVIGEPSFIFILCITVLASMFIAFYDRIGSLSLRDLKLEMAKVESARYDVEQRQKEVREIATSLAEITTFIAAFHRRIGSDESHALEVQWLSVKVRRLLESVGADDKERKRIFRYLDEVRQMDEVKADDRAAGKSRWDSIWSTIKDEIERDNKTAG